jgi:hypothetical protein
VPTDPSEETKPKETKEIKKVDTESHWGVAAGGAWIHDYPGADQGHMHYLVMPTYKGKYVTIDRQDGVKGELVNDNRVKFSMSFIFIFPADSDKVPIRHGMPDLNWTFQLGPEMQVYLMRSFSHTMYFRLPLRFIATTDFRHEFEYRDWNLAPGIRNVFYLGPGWGEITTRLDFDIASESYNDLFYQVDPRYATADRPAYNARGGLMEYIFGVNYSYYDSFPWTFFIGANGYVTSVSVNRDSPLLLKTFNYSIIGGVIRYF